MTPRSSILLIIAIAAAGAVAYFQLSETWTGFVYPSRADRSISKTIGPFRTLFECRDHATAELERMGIPLTTGTYACGLNCDGGAKLRDVQICKEMSD